MSFLIELWGGSCDGKVIEIPNDVPPYSWHIPIKNFIKRDDLKEDDSPVTFEVERYLQTSRRRKDGRIIYKYDNISGR